MHVFICVYIYFFCHAENIYGKKHIAGKDRYDVRGLFCIIQYNTHLCLYAAVYTYVLYYTIQYTFVPVYCSVYIYIYIQCIQYNTHLIYTYNTVVYTDGLYYPIQYTFNIG